MIERLPITAVSRLAAGRITHRDLALIRKVRTDPAANRNRLYVHNLLMFRWWGMTLDAAEQAELRQYVAQYGEP